MRTVPRVEIDGLTHGSADFAKLIAGHPVSCELLDDYRTVQCDLRRGQMPVSSANGSIRNQVDSRVPFTFKSWGENVQAEVFGVDGDVQVQVKSTRRMSTTLIDREKNADNVKRFTDWLTKTV